MSAPPRPGAVLAPAADDDARRAAAACPDVRHPRPFLCRLRAEADEIGDIVDHVWNVRFLAWVDRAAELAGNALGESRRALLAQRRMWFVARHEIDFCAEVRPGDELVVATWVRDAVRVRSWRDTVMIRPRDETVVCRAATLWVLMDLDRRRPARIDAERRARLDPLEDPPDEK